MSGRSKRIVLFAISSLVSIAINMIAVSIFGSVQIAPHRYPPSSIGNAYISTRSIEGSIYNAREQGPSTPDTADHGSTDYVYQFISTMDRQGDEHNNPIPLIDRAIEIMLPETKTDSTSEGFQLLMQTIIRHGLGTNP